MYVKHRNSAMPPIEVISARVAYNPETGELRWKTPDASTFKSEHGWKIWTTKFSGKPVSKVSRGYAIVVISFDGRAYHLQGHRVAWLIANGSWPEGEIDHIDGNRSNNCASNLRQATHNQNQRNKAILSTNKSGFKGVHCHTQNGNWIAQIKAGGKTKHLGSFSTAADAAQAYRNAANVYHQEFARHA